MQADPAWSVHGHERNVFAWCRKGDGPVAHLPAASVAVTTPGANAAFIPPAISRSGTTMWGWRDLPFVSLFKTSTLSAVTVGEGKGPA
jgi:hypothetical protein